MNWTHFLLLLTATYVLYYSLNIAADILRAKRTPVAEEAQDTFFFDEAIEPQLITYEEGPPVVPAAGPLKPEPALPVREVEFHGGLNLKELFRAAQHDLIEFTGAIPY